MGPDPAAHSTGLWQLNAYIAPTVLTALVRGRPYALPGVGDGAGSNRQYRVPVFQRPYVWDGTEVLQVALRFSRENGCNQCRKIEEV